MAKQAFWLGLVAGAYLVTTLALTSGASAPRETPAAADGAQAATPSAR